MGLKYYRNPRPYFENLSASAASATSISVVGKIVQEGGTDSWTFGVAYRTGSGSYTHKSVGKDISTTISSLAAETTYEVRLYAKANNVYTYSEDSVTVTTPAATE